MKTSIVVPARLESTRFPRKILTEFGGKPLLIYILSRLSNAVEDVNVVALVDNQEVFDLVLQNGFKAIMTSTECTSGTERLVSVKDKIDGDFIVNVQCDEPFLPIDFLKNLIQTAKVCPEEIFTGCYPIEDEASLFNSNRVKVVLDKNDCAMYFSRSAIPFVRDIQKDKWIEVGKFFGHIGVYGYKRSFLDSYHLLQESVLEKIEKLEQLRFLENQYKIKVIHTEKEFFGIDTQEDLAIAKKILINEVSL